MFYETFNGFDNEESAPKVSKTFVSSVIAKASERAKRKRQEETFKQRKERQEEAKRKKDKKQKDNKVREVRDETLEERNSRKLAAKLARKKNKENGTFVTQQQLVDALTVKEGKNDKDEAGKGAEASDHSFYEVELAVPERPMDSKVETDEGAQPDVFLNKDETKVPQFYKELNFAHNKNLNMKKVKAFEDEDDARMEMETAREMVPETAPISLGDSVKEWGIEEKIKNNLSDMNIDKFFPVQRNVIPSVMRDNARDYLAPRDMCISAPTGSGKTLAYVVPIVQTLMRREAIQLAALVLLPSRELAVQVHKVFECVARNTGVQVAIATGQRSFSQEQAALVGRNVTHPFSPLTKITKNSFRPCYLHNDCRALNIVKERREHTGRSMVDVLVCTPGRLLDHLEYTTGFTLQHVRFLVLDEADRLLNNAYHNWVKDLVSSIDSLRSRKTVSSSDSIIDKEKKESLVLHRRPPAPLQRLLFSATLTDNPAKLALLNVIDPVILRCAAANVDGMSPLDENEMEKVGASGAFILPPGLEEAILVCTTAKRPALLASVLTEAFCKDGKNASSERSDDKEPQVELLKATHKPSNSSNRPQIVSIHEGICNMSTNSDQVAGVVIIFTTSVDTAHRLGALLRLFNGQSVTDVLHGTNPITDSADDRKQRSDLFFGGVVAGINRNVPAAERSRILHAAEQGLVAVIVATDNMARGIDLPNLRLVINYDPPQQARTYVHRVGRTARAGSRGAAITMLKGGQVGAFRKIRAQMQSETSHMEGQERLPRCKPSKGTEEKMAPRFAKAMNNLAAALGLQTCTLLDIGE